jgi:hypothetical protein
MVSDKKLFKIQFARIFSILSAMATGFWLPLRLEGIEAPLFYNLIFDAWYCIFAAVNIWLHFTAKNLNFRDLKNWFSLTVLLDVFCLIPFLFFEDLFFITGAGKINIILNLIAARHIWNVKDFLEELDNLKPVTYRLIPIALMMPLLVHLVACGWIALGSGTIGPDTDKWAEYIKGVYWAMTTLTTVGYGDISAKTPYQMIYASCSQLIGVGVFGFVVSNVASILSRLDAAREHHMDNLDQIETFMNSYQINPEVRTKVRSYYHYVWKEHRGYMDKSVLDALPGKLQSELNFAINHTIIEKVSFLKSASREMLEDIMLALQHRVFVPDERIFRAGDYGDCLYLIHSGQIAILTADNKPIATLSQGAVFGEVALISDGPRTATAKATGYCDLYVLPKEDFNRIINAYPDFKDQLQAIVESRKNGAPPNSPPPVKAA